MSRRDTLRDSAILLARIGLGLVFVAHGWQKFFTLGLTRVGEQFATIGVPQPHVSAAVVAGIELVGGALLLVGLLTPLAGILLGVAMAGAIYFVHATHGPFVSNNGWELVVALGVGALLVAAVGAGRFSLDHLFGR